MMTGFPTAVIGAVVIGRNEGERLIRCLTSLTDYVSKIVYVDSGSTDESVENAKRLGVEVVKLDMTKPFTAARARNEGADYLNKNYSSLRYIQFVDGDCEIQPDWIEAGYTFLENNSDYAIVSGRRRERFPSESVFNQLCDIEWDTPIGDALSCGGDALISIEAYEDVGGYNALLIAGEEPEMCYRMRQVGWKIRRIEVEMTLHDAGMHRLSQWWTRAKRAGYAYANSFYLHRHGNERFKQREVLSIVFWALLFPVGIISLSLFNPVLTILFLTYPVQVFKVINSSRRMGLSTSHAVNYGVSAISAKFPQLCGVLSFLNDVLSGRQGSLIEYK